MKKCEDFVWTAADMLAVEAGRATPWSYDEQTAMHFDLERRRGYVAPVTDGSGEDRPPWGALHVATAIRPGADPCTVDSAARINVLDQELDTARRLPVVGASFDSEYRKSAAQWSGSATTRLAGSVSEPGRSRCSRGAGRDGRCWSVSPMK